WREGRVWPKSHHMPRHPGCTCVQVPKLVRTCRVSRLLPITRALSVGSLTDGALISNRSGPTDDTTDSDKREQRWKTIPPMANLSWRKMVTTLHLWETHKPTQFGTN